jgi:hypothetical protein
MNRLLRVELVVLAVLQTPMLFGAETAATVKWSEAPQENLEQSTVLADEQFGSVLFIENENTQPLTVQIATFETSLPQSHLFAVRGMVRYEDVETGDVPAFLESWQYFAGGGHYFSRTLGTSGVIGNLNGTSAWREFSLPFQGSEESGPPLKIEVNLVLPSSGKVWIGPLELVSYSPGEMGDASDNRGAWWNDREAGWYGGMAGGLIGIIGAIIGTLCSLGRGRSIAVGLGWLVLVAGVVSLVVGAIAVASGQPYAVYYPLLLIGVIATLVMGGNMRTIGRRFADAELRRMEAMDAQ